MNNNIKNYREDDFFNSFEGLTIEDIVRKEQSELNKSRKNVKKVEEKKNTSKNDTKKKNTQKSNTKNKK